MSYTPTEWKKGDLITSEKLNKIEEGIVDAGSSGGGFLIINANQGKTEIVFDKTLGEIKAAFTSKIPIFVFMNVPNVGCVMGICISYINSGQYYQIAMLEGNEVITFYAIEDSDYPTDQQPSTNPSTPSV